MPAIGIAFLAAIVSGSINGFLIGRMRLNPIVATLGTNALLYGAVLGTRAASPRRPPLASRESAAGSGSAFPPRCTSPSPSPPRHGGRQVDAGRPPLRGRRRERAAARTAGLRAGGTARGLRLGATPLLPRGVLHAGIVNQPTAYEGDNYLLPSVAAVVLGGTSLLGGRGNLVATAIAALFLSQLDQFVLALGVTYATRTLVQAAALAVGVALYTIDWGAIARRLPGRRPTTVAPT